MVNNKIAAEIILTANPITNTEKKDIITPKDKASSGNILCNTRGLFCVRDIMASISLSYHMLSAPEAPDPIVIHNIEIMAIIGLIVPGAITIPTIAVNTTKDITLGFMRVK